MAKYWLPGRDPSRCLRKVVIIVSYEQLVPERFSSLHFVIDSTKTIPSSLRRVVEYQGPPYLLEFGQLPQPLAARNEEGGGMGPSIETATSHETAHEAAPSFAQETRRYPVLNATDEKGQSVAFQMLCCSFAALFSTLGTYTTVMIGDVLAEIRPQQLIKIEETSPELWFAKASHRDVIPLKEDPNLKDCFLVYSETSPRTHVLIGNTALETVDLGELFPTLLFEKYHTTLNSCLPACLAFSHNKVEKENLG